MIDDFTVRRIEKRYTADFGGSIDFRQFMADHDNERFTFNEIMWLEEVIEKTRGPINRHLEAIDLNAADLKITRRQRAALIRHAHATVVNRGGVNVKVSPDALTIMVAKINAIPAV